MRRDPLRGSAARSPSLFEHLLAVTRRGDLQYVREPEAGQFAVLHMQRGEKAFFEAPRGANPQELRVLIEDHFGSAAERVAEFVWVI